MDNNYEDEDIVTIIPGRVEHPDAIYALKSPTFVLRKDGILYATFGAWKYDANDASTPQQQRDIIRLGSDFDDLLEDPGKVVREAAEGSEDFVIVSYQQTSPQEGGE